MDPVGLRDLLALQCGVVSRAQARVLGLTPNDVRRLLRRREWAVVHPGVYVDHTGPPTWEQRAWAAVLALAPAALSHASALGPHAGPIHVAVDRSRDVVAPPGVVRHYLVDLEARTRWSASPPRLHVEHAVLGLAAGADDELDAIAHLADVVGARRTTAARIGAALEGYRRIPRRRFLERVLADVAAGTCSVLEQGYLDRVERPHGLPRARRQRAASSKGTVYRDVEYAAHGLVVELDGRLHHGSAAARDSDMDRDLDAAVQGRRTVRLGWGQVYGRPCRTARRIGVLLQQGGWRGSVLPCPSCAVPRFGVTS
jgi:very-short-patch-repair endonuclease